MQIEEDINAFKFWANRMGCPIECVPSDDALKSLFKSRQSTLFLNIIERVRPKQEVEAIHRNILVSKMKKFKGKTVPACERSFIPREFQRYLEIQDLKKEKDDLEKNIKFLEENSNLELLKNKNIQKIKMRTDCNNLEVKCNILELKLESLTENFEKEQKMKEKILEIMPVKLKGSNASESLATKTVTESLKELDEFYKICLTSSNPHYIIEAKESLWLRLRRAFSNVPNFTIWSVITKMKDEQLEKIKNLVFLKIDRAVNQSLQNNTINNFDIQLMKIKSSIVNLISKYLSVKADQEKLNKKINSAYTSFYDDIQYKINNYSSDASDGDYEIISQYLIHYSTYSYNNGQKDFLISEIERCKHRVEQRNKQLEDHEVLLGSLNQIYSEIDSTVQRTQQDILQLSQIKDKIQYLQALLQHMFKDIQISLRQQMLNQTKQNLSAESFMDTLKLSPVLCSTKLDMDSTCFGNQTIRANTSINQSALVPPYAIELATFMETPISKLQHIPRECRFNLLPNPLITDSSESLSIMPILPAGLLTPEGTISYIKDVIDWYKEIKKVSTDLQTDINIIEVDEKDFKTKLNEQRDQITYTLDQIERIGFASSRSLKKSQNYYKFSLENPLRHFIPVNKLFNNQSYADYDAEYNMYYRMVVGFKK